MNGDADFELLGLQFVLQAHLSGHGLDVFRDYERIEVDCGNGELSVHLGAGGGLGSAQTWQRALRAFAARERFGSLTYSVEKHKYLLKARARSI